MPPFILFQLPINSHDSYLHRHNMKIEDAYTNTKNPSAFSGAYNLKKAGFKDADEYLKGVPAYTLHRPVRYRFSRRKTYGLAKFETLQADLADYSRYKNDNNGYTFLLVCVCCYSRYLFVRPVKNKTNAEVIRAFKSIFEEMGRAPQFLVTDKGREFTGKEMRTFLNRLGIYLHHPSSPENKAAMAERMQRTLKGRLERAMYHKSSRRYITYLQDIASGINHTVNRSIKMAPADVDVLPEEPEPEKKKVRFAPGDLVRISMTRGPFAKGYERGYSVEEFVVTKVIGNRPPVYHLKDYNGEPIRGIFYQEEMVPIKRVDDVYQVEKILDRRTYRGQKQVLVRWFGYGPEFDSWEPEKDVILL